MFKSILFLLAYAISPFAIIAQQHQQYESSSREREERNFLGFFFGNTVIYQSNLHLPTIGVEYLREISPRWGVGLVTELEIGYQVLQNKGQDNEIIIHERKSALLIQPVLACRVYKGLILSAGYGIEYEHYKREKLGLFKLGLEYKLEMKKPGFYMLPSLSWDHTSEFDGLVYGMVFAFDF